MEDFFVVMNVCCALCALSKCCLACRCCVCLHNPNALCVLHIVEIMAGTSGAQYAQGFARIFFDHRRARDGVWGCSVSPSVCLTLAVHENHCSPQESVWEKHPCEEETAFCIYCACFRCRKVIVTEWSCPAFRVRDLFCTFFVFSCLDSYGILERFS